MLRSSIFMISLVLLIGGCTNNTTQIHSNLIEENANKHTITKEYQKQYQQVINSQEYKNTLPEERRILVSPSDSILMNQSLMDFYNEWKNVKYRYGGNSKKGIDCSAFTQRIYKEKFDINIPRSTRTQIRVGKHIKRSELEMGDLVFFKTGKFDRHVGIYMGNGDFMHASIKGVKFTKLDKPYYKRNYWTARRIID
ncbi:NlpC/P60 family protein [Arcobacter sp. LA11]|uniref:NlpC/P60 family protein n=1 Tax=Arcobacter sp. LA11 TaxID=1898176 RepID=UPI001160DC19|nr:NlpC/P60 family protein [Arcobacter sp. LA11]